MPIAFTSPLFGVAVAVLIGGQRLTLRDLCGTALTWWARASSAVAEAVSGSGDSAVQASGSKTCSMASSKRRAIAKASGRLGS